MKYDAMADPARAATRAAQRAERQQIIAYPMGVNVYTSCPVINTCQRVATAIGAVRTQARHFDRIVLISQPVIMKRLVEEGARAGLDWSAARAHVVTGGEDSTENYRAYVGKLIGVDADDHTGRIVGSSMGIGELDLNLFHETRDTIRIVRRAHRAASLRRALFRENARAIPCLIARRAAMASTAPAG